MCDQPKIKLNFVQKLYLREITEYEHYPQMLSNKPPILSFTLRDLVPQSILDEGHVFLGFTKNGQFIISYVLEVDTDLEYLAHTYTLYWWRFLPEKPLEKISEVHLFGDFEIYTDLRLLFCQWPSDETKIIICGRCNEEQIQQCYVTITAVPPIGSCTKCNNGLYSVLADNNSQMLCLQHSFAVHTKYNIEPPYPSYSPQTCLKIDGVVVLNTGHSLFALSVDVNKEECSVPRIEKNCVSGQFSEYREKIVTGKPFKCSSCKNRSKSLNDLVSTNENVNVPENSSTSSVLSHQHISNLRITSHSPIKKRFSDSENYEDIKNFAKNNTILSSDLHKNDFVIPDIAYSDNGEFPAKLRDIDVKHVTNYALDNNEVGQAHKTFDPVESRLQSHDEPTKKIISSSERIDLIDALFGLRKTLDLSPSPCRLCGRNDDLVSQSCITNLECVFIENYFNFSDEDGESIYSDYGNCLPLDVRGSLREKLCYLPKHKTILTALGNQNVTVKQQAFDVEHFVDETAQRICSKSCKQFWALNDYDIQIMDVEPETGNVIVLVIMLIKASPKTNGQSKNATQECEKNSKLYQTSIAFAWNLIRREHYIIGAEELTETNAPKENTRWNPALKICRDLRHRFFIPLTEMKSIPVMTNLPALKGESLKKICDPYHHVLLRL